MPLDVSNFGDNYTVMAEDELRVRSTYVVLIDTVFTLIQR